MKKFKKALLSILSLVLVAVLSIGGTLAYLTSQDSDVNVMTMGNVKIAQHEYERAKNEDGTYKTDTIDDRTSYVLSGFTQDKPLYPAVADPSTYASGWDSIPVRMSQVDSYGGMNVFAEPNAQDKFVTVENTGRSDAYVRTLIAIEIGEGNANLIGTNYHALAWNSTGIGAIEIDNNKYYLFEYVYTGAQLSDGSWRHENGVLPAGDTSYPSLSQVYLKTAATNEDCEALDGNDNGKLDILVLSQAVQTKGFADAKTALDKAFGTPSEKAAEWFGGMTAFDTWDGTADTSWFNGPADYTLTTAEQLAGLAKIVNAGETFKGNTITLASDIDLVNKEWTPIGNSTNKFQGTFDGNGYTINNLMITGNNNYVGLFGYTINGVIKNVSLDNASVSGRVGVGTIAGSPYTSKYENIKVTGDIKVNGLSYVGGVVGRNAYADLTNITLDANKGSYVKANSVENGTAYRTYVGGVVGFMGEGKHTVSNVKSNIDVIGSTTDVGGITGIAHYGNSFVNCTATGNVTITGAENADDAEEIGGIAGVWHNGGADVKFENCKFTGKLSANITEGIDLSDNTITGKAYSTSGSGNLIIK